jgi:hypothetical protein
LFQHCGIFLFYFRTVPTVWYFYYFYFRIVPTVWYFFLFYFRIVPTVWYFFSFYFRFVPTVWYFFLFYFSIVLTVWSFFNFAPLSISRWRSRKEADFWVSLESFTSRSFGWWDADDPRIENCSVTEKTL